MCDYLSLGPLVDVCMLRQSVCNDMIAVLIHTMAISITAVTGPGRSWKGFLGGIVHECFTCGS